MQKQCHFLHKQGHFYTHSKNAILHTESDLDPFSGMALLSEHTPGFLIESTLELGTLGLLS